MPVEHQTINLDGFALTALPAAFYADPYPFYRALRSATPIRRMPDGSLLLTRYRDLDHVYRDTATFRSDKTIEFRPKFGDGPLYEHHTTSLVFNDPPLHTRVRRLIGNALSPRAITRIEPGLIAVVDRLLDAMARKGEVDLIEDFAAIIPIEVIGNLLGVPTAERAPLRGWSLAILGALEPVNTQATLDAGHAAVHDFLRYLDGLIAARRARPGDADTDVLTRLIGETADGERLTAKELLHNCIFILNAGHETTTNLIGNGLEAFDRFPSERQRLLADPTLVKAAVEEVLRFESSNQLGNRRVAIDTRIGDLAVPAGTPITLCIGAANRDPDQFPDPERFDVGRTPNRHLAFAGGAHQCLGLALARMEGRIAFERLLARFPGYRILPGRVAGGRVRFRGFAKLPARLI